MNSETREELKRIQSELRKPFSVESHSIRELPGRGYWAFVPHHEYRERLDEICPEWESSYTHIEQITSDVICKCTITILGISKQAIGSVPLVAAEKNGRDVGRGSAADRLAAEAFKNACEAWGVGRYLDDQASVAYYLNSNAMKLDNETRNKLKSLANYLRQNGDLPPANSNVTMPKLDAEPKAEGVISEGQIKRLWAIAKPLAKEVSAAIVKSIGGVESSKDIPVSKYNLVVEAIEREIKSQESPIPTTSPDRELIMKEIDSLIKRKNISGDEGKAILEELYGVNRRGLLSDKQLIDFKDYLNIKIGNRFSPLGSC